MGYTIKEQIHNDTSLLLERFNDRDEDAFGEVYSLFYKETTSYASMLYRTDKVQPADVIHDIFIKLWQSPNLKFDDLFKIKAYVYVAIKNDFKDFISHRKHIEKHQEIMKVEENFYVDIIENETYVIVENALATLPAECSKIMRMFLEGWKPAEIAEELGCSQQYVYNSKYEAIQLLKKKFSNDNMLLMTILCFFD